MRKKAAAFLGALIACTLFLPPAVAKAETVSSTSSAADSFLTASAAAASSASDSSTGFNVSYDQYQRQIYDIVSSLHCEKTTSIADTGDGKLWIGTYDGLYSFDGQDMEHVDLGSVHAVNALYADADDNLWVGSNDNGISVVQNSQVIAVLKKDGGLPSNTVHTLTGDTDGHILAGTGNGTAVLSLQAESDGKTEITIGESIANVEQPIALAEGCSHMAAAVSEDGFLTLVKNDEAVDVAVPEGDYKYTAAVFSKDNELYAGRDDGGIDVFDLSADNLQQKDKVQVSDSPVINALFFVDDTLFACTESGIAYQADGGFEWIKAEVNGAVTTMEKDFQGNLWFVSPRIGLMELFRAPAVDLFQTAGLEQTVVNTETEWNGILFFGTDKGLVCINPDTGRSIRDNLTEYVGDVPVQCLLSDSKGRLWICTYGDGVIAVNPDKTKNRYSEETGLFGDQTRMAVELSDGRIAICGNDGLSFLTSDGTIENTLVRRTGNAPVLCLTEEDDGTLLAGTEGDGISVIRDGEIEKNLTTADGLASDTVRRISISPETGGIYAVTNNGIDLISRDGTNYSIEKLENQSGANCYNVRFRPDGTMLVTGSKGLFVLKEEDLLHSKGEPDYLLLNEEWGISASLTADACNFIDEDNNYYLASSSGAYQVNLKDYDKIDLGYRLGIRRVTLDGKELESAPGGTFTVGRDVQRISIQPELINFTMMDPTISYYLEGYDKNPVTAPYSQLSEIVYTNLPAGSYRLHLAVLDSHDTTVAEETVGITKPQKFTDYPWFRALLILAGAAAVFAIAWALTFLRMRRKLKKEQAKQREELKIREKQLETANEGIMAIAKALDKRDKYTSQHSERVSQYSTLIGKEMGMSDAECENLRKVALLHDIGKIGVPDSVLNKPGRLTDEEYAIIKKHVDYGAEILSNFTGLDHVVEGAQYHHERYDGKGYTHGLKGEEIPLYGRIIGVADAFDAMTSNRVYRNHLDLEKVLSELERCKGSQFDPAIADIMIRLVKEEKVKPE